jgi:hypothetical protein
MLASLMRKSIQNQVKWGGEEKSTYNSFRHSCLQFSQFLSEVQNLQQTGRCSVKFCQVCWCEAAVSHTNLKKYLSVCMHL